MLFLSMFNEHNGRASLKWGLSVHGFVNKNVLTFTKILLDFQYFYFYEKWHMLLKEDGAKIYATRRLLSLISFNMKKNI